jgi:hypothetical protein
VVGDFQVRSYQADVALFGDFTSVLEVYATWKVSATHSISGRKFPVWSSSRTTIRWIQMPRKGKKPHHGGNWLPSVSKCLHNLRHLSRGPADGAISQ